jgi:DNA polymerase IV
VRRFRARSVTSSATGTLAPVIAHLDLDAFFAAVELHRRPELRGRPLIVGGTPAERGVVATASYDARRYGIRSAMSTGEALRRCPHAVVVPPDHATYRQWSARVWELVCELAPTVERVGIDEGYLVLADGEPGERAGAVQAALRERLRLSCSLGVATGKTAAKVASDMRKPGGITVVPAGGEAAFLAPLPVSRLPGVGPKTEARLTAAGVATIGALASLDDGRLAALVPGRVGDLLRERARGVDPRRVAAEPAETVSISSERTFAHDLSDRRALHRYVDDMAAGVAASLGERGLCARTVTAKLRYPDFQIATRSHTLTAGTDSADVIAARACALLDRALRERPGALRLVGVGVSGLEAHRQLTLL